MSHSLFFLVLQYGLGTYLSFHFLLFTGTVKSTFQLVLFFFLLSLGLVTRLTLVDLFIIIIIIIIVIIIIIIYFLGVFQNGLSLEFEREQVSSSLQDSSLYSVHS